MPPRGPSQSNLLLWIARRELFSTKVQEREKRNGRRRKAPRKAGQTGRLKVENIA
jgi:hypothetical protein